MRFQPSIQPLPIRANHPGGIFDFTDHNNIKIPISKLIQQSWPLHKPNKYNNILFGTYYRASININIIRNY